MADLNIAKGDKGFYLNFTVQDADGNVFNLTDYTASLKAWPLGKPGSPIVSATCAVTDTTGGLCHYQVATNDFMVAGTFQLELECTKTGIIESTDAYTIEVKESP